MKVTLKDIAEDTGYAVSTVSRVLNSTRKMNPKTERAIYQSAKRLNYFTHRSMAHNRFLDALEIGLVFTQFQSADLFASVQQAFNYAAQKEDILFSVTNLSSSMEEFVRLIQNLASKDDGLILYAPEFTRADYQKVKHALPEKYPVISNGPIVTPCFPTVAFDGYSAGYVAAEHLATNGYGNCGFVGCSYSKMEGQQLLNGFTDGLTQYANMELSWEYQSDISPESGRQAFKSFRKLQDKPDAIFISNDLVCHAFLDEALNHNYDIPEDIALIGYGNLPICEQSQPTLTSLNTDYLKLGGLSVSMIQQFLSFPNQDEAITNLVPVDLKEREST